MTKTVLTEEEMEQRMSDAGYYIRNERKKKKPFEVDIPDQISDSIW